ncbi:MAG: hypothetical protein AAF456_16280 [Planctomycetota bacterium]
MKTADFALIIPVAAALVLSFAASSEADITPDGHRDIRHRIVFEDSPALEEHTLIASPQAGFNGVVEIKPGEAFDFSSKYGTRFYVVPPGTAVPTEFDRELLDQWPSTRPPRGEIRSVVIASPVASALTTVKLVEVNEDGPVVEEVGHVEFNRSGSELTPTKKAVHYTTPIAVLAATIFVAAVLWRKYRNVDAGESKGSTA